MRFRGQIRINKIGQHHARDTGFMQGAEHIASIAAPATARIIGDIGNQYGGRALTCRFGARRHICQR